MVGATRRSVVLGITSYLACPSFARARPLDVVGEYEAASGGYVGFYAEDLQTGRKLKWRSDERFVMCSTFKASLAACILASVDRGQMRLEEEIHYGAADLQDWYAPVAKANLAEGYLSIEAMCQAAVEQSDNTCANILLDRIGGASSLTSYWRQLGDSTTRLDDPEPYLNRTPLSGLRNTTTPASMAKIFRALAFGRCLSPLSRNKLLAWLKGCKTGDHRLRAGLPKEWVIGNKTGNNGSDAAGDVALVWPKPHNPIVVSVYTRGGLPTGEMLDLVFAGIAHHVATTLA